MCVSSNFVQQPETRNSVADLTTMMATKTLLYEALNKLSPQELDEFKSHIELEKSFSLRARTQLKVANTRELVELMYRQECVEMIGEVLKKMKRTDLIQMSEVSSGTIEKRPVDEHLSTLIHKVATTLTGFSFGDLERFKWFLQLTCFHKGFPYISWRRLEGHSADQLSEVMVEMCGFQSVDVTGEVLMDMNRTDMDQRMSEISSGLKEKDERCSALIQKEEAMVSVIRLLLETLSDLSVRELSSFNQLLLSEIRHQRHHSDVPWTLLMKTHLEDTVFLMVQTYGEESVKMTEKILEKMKRTDLVQRLFNRSSGTTKKASVDERCSALIQKVATVAAVKHLLLENLNDLSVKELQRFKEVLQLVPSPWGTSVSSWRLSSSDNSADLVDVIMETYSQRSVEVTKKGFKEINRTDLVQRLSETSSRLKGDSRSLEVKICGRTMPESSDWTKLEPEVNSTEADEALTYSLQSEAGRFECSVSALRWVCKEKVSLKYQFNSWEDHMERMKSRQYMPAGPLMNITVNAGRLDEVYLPHWICIDDDPTVTDNFAALHIDECGDVVEKVSEVTPSHVKLSEPVFSPRTVLVKVGLPVKIRSYILIYYKPNLPVLKLHVYVIPKDPALQKTVDRKEISYKYEIIRKSDPDKSLKMKQGFTLTADIETAEILPKELTLRHESDPNFFEVFVKNPDRDFYLTLSQSSTNEQVWRCQIQKDDYPSSGNLEAAESAAGACCGAAQQVDEHLPELIQKAIISSQSKVRERLLDTLECLKEEDFKKFKWYLENSYMPRCQLENSDILGVVDLIVQTHSQQSVEVTKSIYKKINRNDLVEMLSGSSS